VLYDYPLKQFCHQYHGKPGCIGGPARSHLALLVEVQLFAEKEVLSGEDGSGLKETAQESNEVHGEVKKGEGGVRKAFA